jgi:hypothetical protein
MRRPVRPYPLRAWASKQSPISSHLRSHLRSTALTAFSLLCLPPSASVPRVEHCRWELLLPPHAPPCHHRLGIRSPSQPPLGADRTSPLTLFPSDEAMPPTAKDLHDVSPCRSSSGLISAVLSTTRTPDNFPTQEPAPTTADRPLHAISLWSTTHFHGKHCSSEILPRLPPPNQVLTPRCCSRSPSPPVPGFRLTGISRRRRPAPPRDSSPVFMVELPAQVEPAASFGPVQQYLL